MSALSNFLRLAFLASFFTTDPYFVTAIEKGRTRIGTQKNRDIVEVMDTPREYTDGVTKKTNKNPYGRSLNSKAKCGSCPFDIFYHYESLNNGQFRRAMFQAPGNCVLAAIRGEESRRGAQYAVPPGEIALTQGYFDTEEYLKSCRFADEKTVNGTVTACFLNYNQFFDNYEGGSVPSENSLWVNATFPLPDGALYAAIGADGLLRPVVQTSNDKENFGYSGAVYECCPGIREVCEIEPDSN